MSTINNLCQQSQVHRLYSLYLHYDGSQLAKHENPECDAVLEHCLRLMEKDYVVGTVSNQAGQLCPTYPAKLAIFEKERVPAPRRDHTERVEPSRITSTTVKDVLPTPQGQSLAGSNSPNIIDPYDLSRQQQPQPEQPEQRQHNTSPIPTADAVSRSLSQRQPQVSLVHDQPALLSTSSDHDSHGFQFERFTSTDSTEVDNEEADDTGLGESMLSFQDIRAELEMASFQAIGSNLRGGNGNRGYELSTTTNSSKANGKITPRSSTATSARVHDPDKVNDTAELANLFEKSRFARVRARFVVPCILVRGKNICRSATLSKEVEVFMNLLNQKRKDMLYGPYNSGEKMVDKDNSDSSLEKQRAEDIVLLHQLGVLYINDLMVENRKVKYGVKVTSSEKVDSFGRYARFKLVATPYPGVEFFQKFKANKYSARKLCFDWSQNFADAELQLPKGHSDNLGIVWKDYKQWDLIELTQNYLRLYLTHIADESETSPSQTGLLVHCISGWDRTPLFISLLRISLWADGEIHQTLSATEMLYLTMGYDWFLFNHLLADRSQRGEDIFFFCFYFLKFIYGDEFSLDSCAKLQARAESGEQEVDTQRVPKNATASWKHSHNSQKEVSREQSVKCPSDGTSSEFICQSCQRSGKSPWRKHSAVGRPGSESGSFKNAHGAPGATSSSSADLKPSSWQLVSFSTPPKRSSGGRAADFGGPRENSLPLGTGSSGIHFANQPSLSQQQQESKRSISPEEEGSKALSHAVSPHHGHHFDDVKSLLGEALAEPIAHAKRLSTEGVAAFHFPTWAQSPYMSGAQSTTKVSPSRIEFSRVATSPDLTRNHGGGTSAFGRRMSTAEIGRHSSGDLPSPSGEDPLSTFAGQENPPGSRKRASTLDGGLLLDYGADSILTGSTSQLNKDDTDDLSSGVDEEDIQDIVPEQGSQPDMVPVGGRQCGICKHFVRDLDKTPTSVGQQLLSSSSDSSMSSAAVFQGQEQSGLRDSVRGMTRQQVQENSSPFLNSTEDWAPTQGQYEQDKADQDESMFQLEIDDRTNVNFQNSSGLFGSSSKLLAHPTLSLGTSPSRTPPPALLPNLSRQSQLQFEHPSSLSSGGQCGMDDKDQSCCDEENDSLWDVTSTADYEHSPRSIHLVGREFSMTRYPENDHSNSNSNSNTSLQQSRARSQILHGSVVHNGVEEREVGEDDDDDDEDNDDCAASLGSRPGSLLNHSPNDGLFLPSLNGVFSSAERQQPTNYAHYPDRLDQQLHQRLGDASNNMTGLGLQPSSQGATGSGSSLLDRSQRLHKVTAEAAAAELPPPLVKYSRRQKLRELRRLFMDVRDEIGDGSKNSGSPSRMHHDTQGSRRIGSGGGGGGGGGVVETTFRPKFIPGVDLDAPDATDDDGEDGEGPSQKDHPRSRLSISSQQQSGILGGRKSPFAWAAAATNVFSASSHARNREVGGKGSVSASHSPQTLTSTSLLHKFSGSTLQSPKTDEKRLSKSGSTVSSPMMHLSPNTARSSAGMPMMTRPMTPLGESMNATSARLFTSAGQSNSRDMPFGGNGSVGSLGSSGDRERVENRSSNNMLSKEHHKDSKHDGSGRLWDWVPGMFV